MRWYHADCVDDHLPSEPAHGDYHGAHHLEKGRSKERGSGGTRHACVRNCVDRSSFNFSSSAMHRLADEGPPQTSRFTIPLYSPPRLHPPSVFFFFPSPRPHSAESMESFEWFPSFLVPCLLLFFLSFKALFFFLLIAQLVRCTVRLLFSLFEGAFVIVFFFFLTFCVFCFFVFSGCCSGR